MEGCGDKVVIYTRRLSFDILRKLLASPMDGARYTVTLNELKLFHGVDRTLYIILVQDLWRNPSESLQVMGLWLWLERGGICHFIKKILALPPFLIDELADEGVICVNCINNQLPSSPEAAEIPLTSSLVERDISLQFFIEHQFTAYHEIQNLVSEVCIPALSDIMEKARSGGFIQSSIPSNIMMSASSSSSSQPRASKKSLVQSFSSLNIDGGRSRASETSWYDRTMFVTFSKGYPVSENEVRHFFRRIFGECIESFHMQEVRPDEQALYAKIVFLKPSFTEIILEGVKKAKFTINGKHVWMRKFVPKNATVSLVDV